MFIQAIRGKVGDETALRNALDRWRTELMPDAVGYLGTTAGITDDGTFVALARFESADAARANSERPQQGEWWAETAKCFAGDVEFLDCPNVRTWLDGGSDDAGFVQVMKGRSSEVTRLHDMMGSRAERVREGRPEIIGGLMLEPGDDRWINVIYFRSEQAAREGEQQEMADDVRAEMDEVRRLMGEVTYYDLRDPILVSP